MKKLFAYIFALSIILFIFVSVIHVIPLNSLADVGDFNDYGGGDDYGGGGDYDSGGWDSDGGDGELTLEDVIALIVVIGIIVLIAYIYDKKAKKNRGSAPVGQTGQPTGQITQTIVDHTAEIAQAVLQIDPQFSSDNFIAWVKEIFFTMQYAWMARDWEKIRPFEKEELYKQHEMQIRQYIDNGRINVLERININQAYLQKYVRDKDYEYLTVFLQVRMTDYIKDEKTGQIINGSPNIDSHMKYLYTFMRKTGVLTSPASENKSTTNCPNCGAPTNITSAGKCEYCGSIITIGVFDWVLSNIDGVKPHTVIDNSGVIIRDNNENK